MKKNIGNTQQPQISRKSISIIFSVFCIISMIICVIVNLAIAKEITWSLGYLISIPFVWALCMPLLTKSKHFPMWLASASIFAIPYLYFLESISSFNNWFTDTALPIAIIGIITIWVCFFALKIFSNKWFIVAFVLFILGAIVSPIVNLLACYFSNQEINISMKDILSVISCVVISIVLCIIGFKTKNKTL